jgi:integrative and conjugative element protein (TIGR02256 family)
MNIEYEQKDINLKIIISEELIAEMKAIAFKHFPNEFGGVLVGTYSEDGLTVCIQKLICPKKYKQTPTFFKRKTTFINKKLKEVYEVSNGKEIYIGEWHSHPNMSAYPSLHDLLSMRKILKQDIKITNPLLLIVGGTETNLHINYFIIYHKKLLKYEQSKP